MTACGAPVRDKSQLYANLSISFGVISAAAVLARVLFKIFVTSSELGLDDYFIFITLLVGVPSTILNVRGMASNGLGKDVWTLPYHQITSFVRVFYVMEILYFTQVALLKLSLLYFYLRIFPGAMIKRLLWGTIAFDILFAVVFVFTAIFQCQPISYYWNEWDGEHAGHCININALGWSNAAISITLDVWMLAIPLSQLMHLEMHWKKKVGVAMMFCVGTFVTVVSILRLQSLVHFANSLNPTWDQWGVSNWSTIEINVGIICACMPAIRVILVRFFPKLLGTNLRRQGYYASGNSNIKIGSRSRSQNRRGSSRLDSVETPTSGGSDNKIMFERTYDVYYSGEHDETRLVPMEDLDAVSKKSRRRASDLGVH